VCSSLSVSSLITESGITPRVGSGFCYSGWMMDGWMISFTPISPEGYAGYNYLGLSLVSICSVPLHARNLCLVKACGEFPVCGPEPGTQLPVEIEISVNLLPSPALRLARLCSLPIFSSSVHHGVYPQASLRCY
jgi:hypothetical protein